MPEGVNVKANPSIHPGASKQAACPRSRPSWRPQRRRPPCSTSCSGPSPSSSPFWQGGARPACSFLALVAGAAAPPPAPAPAAPAPAGARGEMRCGDSRYVFTGCTHASQFKSIDGLMHRLYLPESIGRRSIDGLVDWLSHHTFAGNWTTPTTTTTPLGGEPAVGQAGAAAAAVFLP